MNRTVYQENIDLRITNLQYLLLVLKAILEKHKTSKIKITIEKLP